MSSQLRYFVFLFLVVIAATHTAIANPANSSLVAAYAFDEGAGRTVSDASGHGNVGTIFHATWTTAGKYGKALVFNGPTHGWTLTTRTRCTSPPG